MPCAARRPKPLLPQHHENRPFEGGFFVPPSPLQSGTQRKSPPDRWYVSADAAGRILIAANTTFDLGTVEVSKSMTVSIDAADFASFIGTDAFELNCESIASNATTGGGANVAVTQSPRAGCRATATYTYTEAPGNRTRCRSPARSRPTPSPASPCRSRRSDGGDAGRRCRSGRRHRR